MGAAARLNYFLFPSLYTRYLYVGDGLRRGFVYDENAETESGASTLFVNGVAL